MVQTSPDTRGTGATFPLTPISCFSNLKAGRGSHYGEHLERLCRLYWKPVYAFIHRRTFRDRARAEDLTQEFFVWAFESELFLKFDPARGNFRPFLKDVLRNFLCDEHRRAGAAKRGGGRPTFVLNEELDPDALPASLSPEEAFDQRWVRDVLLEATKRLEAALAGEGRGAWFQALKLYDLEDPPKTYPEVAALLRVTEGDVRNYLHRARTRLREIVLQCLREYIGSDEAVAEEMRDVLKI